MLYALCEEAEVYRTAFEKEKELTDRAMKLAEVGKPKPNWELDLHFNFHGIRVRLSSPFLLLLISTDWPRAD